MGEAQSLNTALRSEVQRRSLKPVNALRTGREQCMGCVTLSSLSASGAGYSRARRNARWLYSEEERPYKDSDIMASPGDIERAEGAPRISGPRAPLPTIGLGRAW